MTVSLSGLGLQSQREDPRVEKHQESHGVWLLLDIIWASTVALPLNLPAASLLGLLGLERFLFSVLRFYLSLFNLYLFIYLVF